MELRPTRFFGSFRETASVRESPIGVGIHPIGGVIVAVLALAVTAADLHLVPWHTWEGEAYPTVRVGAGLAVMVVIASLALARRAPLVDRLAAIGLRRTIVPSWQFWRDATIAFGVAFGVLAASMVVVHVARYGAVWPPGIAPPAQQDLWRLLVEAPLHEEVIYRWMLVTALVAVVPRWAAIVISSVAFGYLHVVYGAAAPNNLLAGVCFGWAYLKSGHIGMPIAFHVLGNGAVHAANTATYALIG